MANREQFEAWCLKRGLSTDTDSDSWGQQKYKYDRIQCMWEGWMASRNALEIKLPPAINTEEIGVAISKERTMARLAFAGINVIEGDKKNV
ncbi:hypothetical protein I6H07_13880 [Hafnia alvei]|uniref:hypothetical protein n=1 Tax=Hafnia alvei TaxID=569 RepID=UPI000B6F1F2A|nr:hypothetical protein [Hafnia alvei]MBI0276867.1 hypothetical protein [Hafnia alvei]PNK99909.1 hypothetical protein CEQ28_021120 [Hafnia alvei]